jgi:hypothetical protein
MEENKSGDEEAGPAGGWTEQGIFQCEILRMDFKGEREWGRRDRQGLNSEWLYIPCKEFALYLLGSKANTGN